MLYTGSFVISITIMCIWCSSSAVAAAYLSGDGGRYVTGECLDRWRTSGAGAGVLIGDNEDRYPGNQSITTVQPTQSRM